MRFAKMHGAGNDFSLFDGIHDQLPDYPALARAVCDRHFGVGGDGIMVALPSAAADVKMVYYNSDGSKGEMCGNGIRCFAKFVYEKGLVPKPTLAVETEAGLKEIQLTIDGAGLVDKVSVAMGRPIFASGLIPTTLEGDPVKLAPLRLGERLVLLTALRLGVPHSVIVTEDLAQVDLPGLGSQIEAHPAFPERINVNFMEVLNRREIKVKTFERGAGHTLACGTGCCSCAVAGHLLGLLDDQVTVRAEGGVLEIGLSPDYDVTLRGTAQFICEGEYSAWLLEQVAAEAVARQNV
ncbi:MAG: diaminopimelate epimerase [Peptococcaceae bacterium]|jgi:diaminopimelate epimerase|nr:diaminopimelate epimerase [Peptococcaceae bacterium]